MSVRILEGDCRDVLKALPDQSVNCIVTSPPYFGLRDYGHEGQLGLEPTPDDFVAALVAVFAEARRVLRDDGTVWLNLGDSYGGPKGDSHGSKRTKGHDFGNENVASRNNGTVAKQLIGIPWRVAFALQSDGWYLRQDIIWHKMNPMPESVKDRCTKAHEYIFLLSKEPRYYYNAEAIEERGSAIPCGNLMPTKGGRAAAAGDEKHRTSANLHLIGAAETRNRRSVWTVASQPYSGAHFATFPPDLIKPCIKAGCPVGGTVLDPFGGAGTTGLVADRLQRNAILIELNPSYATLARERIAADAGLFMEAAE